jgi:hypothetical protein
MAEPVALGGLTAAEFEVYRNLKTDQRRNYLRGINKLYILEGKKKK